MVATVNDIPTLDGRIIPVLDIRMSDGWDFYRVSSGERLTWNIRQSDKLRHFPGFDRAKSNDMAFRELGHGQGRDVGEPQSTNTTGIFVEQIITDPLAAPSEFAAEAVDATKKALASPVTWAIVAAVVVALVVIYVPRPRP